jgi:lipopolysaccharide biosynthesis protein/glycosyltransferase involved in cell wall biosynthesis
VESWPHRDKPVNSPRRALVCSYFPPEPDRESGSKRIFDLIQLLRSDGWAVAFLASERLGPAIYTQSLQRLGIPVFDGAKVRVEELLQNAQFELVLFAFWPVAEVYLPVVRQVLPEARVIVDSVDLHFLRYARRTFSNRSANEGPAALDARFGSDLVRELNVYVAADAVLTVSDKEAGLLTDLSGNPRLAKTVPDFEESTGPIVPRTRRSGMVFLGSFRHEPNIDALLFLCHEIIPRLDARILAANPISVVGDKLDPEIAKIAEGLPHIKIVGWVPSVTPYLARARVSLIPLRFGAGTKRKILQAALVGTPCVSTSIGVEGLNLSHGKQVLVADTPDQFAKAIGRLLSDSQLWSRLSGNARVHLGKVSGRTLARAKLRQAIKHVLAAPTKTVRLDQSAAPSRKRVNKYDYEQIRQKLRELAGKHLPQKTGVLVISRGDDELLRLNGSKAWHFPCSADGVYLGYHPADSAEAIARLKAARAFGAEFLVLPATAYWWLDHYQGFRDYLQNDCAELAREDEVGCIYQLTSRKAVVSGKETVSPSIDSNLTDQAIDPVRLIAFYLPQFHSIPENDAWWGKGFTEWTNVRRAKPLFSGHYQPQAPGMLGYYDLLDPKARRAQASLAREYGIHGFCYYHYWFSGKQLLEQPFNEVLRTAEPDFPFCLCWANEPWSRRWNGQPKDILQAQHYSQRDDLAHIRNLLPALSDKRAIRVAGRPMLLVYRAQELPNPARTIDLWRKETERAGLPQPYLVAVETGWDAGWDATLAGFDAKVLFQPQFTTLFNSGAEISQLENSKLRVFDYQRAWPILAKAALVAYRHYETVCPSWDNSPRVGENAVVLHNSSPAAYQEWLTQAIHRAKSQPPEHRLVFINAWNEWGEGCHLEPDQRSGLAYLEATHQALAEARVSTIKSVAIERILNLSEPSIAPRQSAVLTSVENFKSKEQHPIHAEYATMLAAARGERGPEYVPLLEQSVASADSKVKLIAFYLPQFHGIPENDQWWGRGFTEWTNVSKAVPQFTGHHQPHLPGELGFYDLRVNEVQRRQVELAKHYGLAGFCFYFYWFSGKRLLERPLEQFLSDSRIDFPFCLCWANENWTRRWDGREEDILIGQNYCEKTDLEFIRDIEPMLRHKNYIRVHGRPLLIVYRPKLLPDPKATVTRWREYCLQTGLEDPYLVAAQVFEKLDPREIGFDAAVEFPPNTPGIRREISREVPLLNPGFSGHIHPYSDLAELTVGSEPPEYELFRTVCPSWDNEPRRPGRGTIYAGSTPAAYATWLERACQSALTTADTEKRIVFINAWNEWGEGAHLEPDRKYGYGYLQATSEVLRRLPSSAPRLPKTWTILFISHDACRAGAQRVLLNVIAWFKRHTAITLKVICLGDGEWLPKFKALAETRLWSEIENVCPRDPNRAILDFCGGRPDLIYGNSVASGRVYEVLKDLRVPILTHVHELEMSIKRYASEWIGDVIRHSSHFLACSNQVTKNLITTHGVDPDEISTVLEFIEAGRGNIAAGISQPPQLKAKLGLPVDKKLIVGCGLGMLSRKGADLFLEVARHLRLQNRTDFHCCWVGDFDRTGSNPSMLARFEALKQSEQEQVSFVGVKDDPWEYLAAADIFLLPSREDPFPLVALEAADCGLPIVCFEGAGGIPDFVGKDCGAVVPLEDSEAMAREVALLLDDDAKRQALGAKAREKRLLLCSPDVAGPQVFSVCRQIAGKPPVVSVIVPNFNHARYLRQRLDSLFKQTFRDFEVILLDDCSTDDSLSILRQYAARPDVRLIENTKNSGSTFKQWLKGIQLAKAGIIWIAESDDACEPDFLETLLPCLSDERVKLAYANSVVIDENDKSIGDYTQTDYLQSLSRTKWNRAYQATAEREINDGLGIKNTILSASSVLFKKFKINPATQRRLENMRIAGDWYFFVHAIENGEVYYTPRKLNFHRRHTESVIGKLLREKRVDEFFEEFYAVLREVIKRYELEKTFHGKWESYLVEQWTAFFPERTRDELESFYPLKRASQEILAKTNQDEAAPELVSK